MKLSCLQEDLSGALKVVTRATAKHTTLPVLSNVLLEAEDELKLSATDLEIGMTSRCLAEVEEPGSITVPSRTLVDWVNSLRNEKIELTQENQTLKLRCGKQKANIKGIGSEEFPAIPAISGGFELPSEQLMIDRAYIGAAKDESRPVLTGILVKLEGGILTLASADGFRLSVCETEVDTDVTARVICPANSLKELARIANDNIQVELRENQVLFRAGDICIVSQLINGTFPDYKQIIPKESTTKVVVDVDALKGACSTAKIFAREAANIIRLDIKDTSMAITSTSTEYGDSVGVIDVKTEGDGMEIALNVSYLLDLLGVVEGQLQLGLTTSSSPVLAKQVGDNSFQHVIMPMHL